MGSNRNPLLLDVDPSIIENNLLLTSNDGELPPFLAENDTPYKLVTPAPGFCVKLRRRGDGEKVFVNVCHTKDIPPPEDISEVRLAELLQENDGTCNYRVPLSIGEARQEPDKAGNPAAVYDVAINSSFFNKVESSQMFRLFLIDVVLQGIEEKFRTEVETDDYVILKNRRNMGSLPAHRIRSRDQRDPSQPRPPLVQELGSGIAPASAAGAAPPSREKPSFRLLRQRAALVAQFKLPKVVSAREVHLDVGEDRVVLDSTARNYHVDFFLPDPIEQERTSAKFDIDTKILTVNMPLVSAR